jgi:hypothetical protein
MSTFIGLPFSTRPPEKRLLRETRQRKKLGISNTKYKRERSRKLSKTGIIIGFRNVPLSERRTTIIGY